MNAYLAGVLVLLAIWAALFLVRPRLRRKMLTVSLWTMPLGLTEPLFVPEYWTPPSLFDLAATTGFDLESLGYSFAAGGIASVLYDALVPSVGEGLPHHERMTARHRYHRLALLSPVLAFAVLEAVTSWNPIYTTIGAMFVGILATALCRPDLVPRLMIGAIVFFGLYFVFFLFLLVVFPAFTEAWNWDSLTGFRLLAVPMEELAFAASLGGLWSSIYEHARWIRRASPSSAT